MMLFSIKKQGDKLQQITEKKSKSVGKCDV